ncbi:hypothetical protein FACS18942_04120 [Planctomycetales bacterium]|nr:hypothetical protein FACS18942_04120 [Planctomycetales bacterium]
MKTGSSFGSIRFNAGETSVYIPITTFNDSVIEPTETIRLVLTTGVGNYELGDQFEAIVNIADNDTQTMVRVDSVQHGVEGEQDGYIRLQRNRTDQPLTIGFEYDVNASTAILNQDFAALPGMMCGTNTGSVTFGIGEEFVDIPVKLLKDNIAEPDKQILIRLYQGDPNSAASYFITGSLNVNLNITDNDEASQVWFGEIVNATEGETAYARIYRNSLDGVLNVRIRYNDSLSSAKLNTDFTFGGIFDQTTNAILVTFNDGQTFIDLPIYTLNDEQLEDDETISLTLLDSTDGRYVVNGNRDAAVTILDAGLEVPEETVWRVGVIATDAYASENGQNTGEFTFTRAGQSDLSQPLTIRFALSGTATLNADYTGINAVYDSVTQTWNGSVTIPTGQSHYVLTVTPLLDNLTEGTETIVLTLLPSGETDEQGQPLYTVSPNGSALVQIEDKTEIVDTGTGDGDVESKSPIITVIATAPFASENSSNTGEFTITRSGSDLTLPLSVAFVITGTATLNTDYTGMMRLTIP